MLNKLFSTFTSDQPLVARENDSLCLYPFFNVMSTASGHYKPCCKFNGHLAHRGVVLQTPQHTFNDAWTSDDMQRLREELMRGEKPEGCKVCWDEESKGIKSMRFDSYDYGVTKKQLETTAYPTRIDLYPGNICNLKCRICSPHYSSKWIQEAKDTMGIVEEVHQNLTDENFAQLKQWLPRIKEIGLFGGEPLYMKETVTMLEYCAGQGFSKNITLLINTNGTIYSDKIMQLFRQFKRVVLNFSIDDMEQRFEYERKGAVWSEVVRNMQAYLSNGGSIRELAQIECKICCTVNIFNIYYLPELLQWIDAHLPGIKVYLNMLHGPYSLSAKNFPQQVKDAIAKKLSDYKPVSLDFNEKTTRTLDDVVEFLSLKPNLPFNECLKEIERGDAYRKESFAAVFPELNDLIRGKRD